MSNNTNTTTQIVENNTDSGSSSLPETSPKSRFLKSRERAEMARTIAVLEAAKTAEKLNSWERDFVTEQIDRFKKFGLKTQMTLAQVMTINRVLLKAAA